MLVRIISIISKIRGKTPLKKRKKIKRAQGEKIQWKERRKHFIIRKGKDLNIYKVYTLNKI